LKKEIASTLQDSVNRGARWVQKSISHFRPKINWGLSLRTWIIVIVSVLLSTSLTVGILYAFNPSLFQKPFQPIDATFGKTIRFYHAEEVSNLGLERYVDFIWKPNDASNNAILDVAIYFQYYTPNNTYLHFSLNIDGIPSTSRSHLGADPYGWLQVHADNEAVISNPNLVNHTIAFTFGNDAAPDELGGTLPVYVKDLNIILEVIDGLQPSAALTILG
jgi:hypothetical protein